MSEEKLCKTVRQYHKEPISPDDFEKLKEIAKDYRYVKNYVYQRYGGIHSLSKLYAKYTVQNEMTESGVRGELGLPSVYFYLAVFEALGDIKTQWTKTKREVLQAIKANEWLKPEEKHYLRFVIKVNACFDGILTGREAIVPDIMQETYLELVKDVDTARLNHYLCRQVRKKLKKLHTEKVNGFSMTERAYRYGEQDGKHGIYISTKVNRKRIFVPLTDENMYKKQISVRLKPEERGIELTVPMEVRVCRHRDYDREIGLSMGMYQMLTTDRGQVYGERFGVIQQELADFMRDSDRTYRREKRNNSGRKKYRSRKRKLTAALESYVNHEINRMLAAEKPKIIYIPQFLSASRTGFHKEMNYSVTVWKRGYIRKRLVWKCKEQGVEIVEVFGKGISSVCSVCGETGSYEKDRFRCARCGYEALKKVNAARNAIWRGKQREAEKMFIRNDLQINDGDEL